MTSKPDGRLDRLPTAIINRLTKPFVQFFEIEAAAGLVLLVFTIGALTVANSPWVHSFTEWLETQLGIRFGSFDFVRSIKEWINDALMTLFFSSFLELKRELVLGELNSPRVAALSIAGPLGGMLMPATLYRDLHSGCEHSLSFFRRGAERANGRSHSRLRICRCSSFRNSV